MKTPPPPDQDVLQVTPARSERDRRFLLFVGMVMVALALGFKSELIAPGQVWGLGGGVLILACPALIGYLRSEAGLPPVEHFIPVAIGAVAVAGLSVLVPEWWKYALVATAFGLGFYLSGQLDYRRLREQEKPGHLIVQEALLAVTLAAAYLVVLVIFATPPVLALRLLWVFVISALGAYRSFRVLGRQLPTRRAFLFGLLVAQVVAFFAWALSVYLYFPEGIFAVMLLLAWYINRGVIRHTVEETLSRQVFLEYGMFGAVLAYLFATSYQPH